MIKVDISRGFDLASYHYAVRTDAATDKELYDRDRYGECHHRKAEVLISSDWSEDQYSQTFCHELVEALNVRFCNEHLSHDEITNIAEGLAQALKSLGIIFFKEPHRRRG